VRKLWRREHAIADCRTQQSGMPPGRTWILIYRLLVLTEVFGHFIG